jgi:hypothetical protein
MLRFAKPGLALAILVLMPVGLAAILALSAMADPPDPGAGQEAAGSQEATSDWPEKWRRGCNSPP